MPDLEPIIENIQEGAPTNLGNVVSIISPRGELRDLSFCAILSIFVLAVHIADPLILPAQSDAYDLSAPYNCPLS